MGKCQISCGDIEIAKRRLGRTKSSCKLVKLFFHHILSERNTQTIKSLLEICWGKNLFKKMARYIHKAISQIHCPAVTINMTHYTRLHGTHITCYTSHITQPLCVNCLSLFWTSHNIHFWIPWNNLIRHNFLKYFLFVKIVRTQHGFVSSMDGHFCFCQQHHL